MSNIEKMRKYIAQTERKDSHRYQMSVVETIDLAHAAAETPVEIICLAFEYGLAKGYRAAKAEARKG